MRTIVHLDADAFFASVEQAADPRLRGKAVAVGGETRGIIAAASYEARKYGVYTPMPTVRARKLCPKLIVLPGDFEKYERFSRWMFSYAYDFTPDVEITSIDEGYFELTGVRKSPVEIAQTVRRAIGQSLKITVSEGIAGNKLVSQIASKLNKPAAFFQVPAGNETRFLHPLANHWLPGVGPKTASRLNAAGLLRVGQVAATPVDLLQLLVGGLAPGLREFAQGIDERPLLPVSAPAKSYSHQETFEEDITDEEFAEAVLCRMADRLMIKVREEGKSIRTLTVKVRYNDMAEDQASESLVEPTNLETDVHGRLCLLLRHAWKRRVSLRLVSLKFSNIHSGLFCVELPLQTGAQPFDARRRLARAVDELRRNYGSHVVLRGHDFRLQNPPQPDVEKAAASASFSFSSAPQAKQVSTSSETLPAPNHGAFPVSERPSRPARLRPDPRRLARNYLPLGVRSYYSFLNSTLSPSDIVALAKRHGLPAVALTDIGGLHGAPEFVQAARKEGIRPVVGAEITAGRQPVWLYAANRAGYSNLCRLLSLPVEESSSNPSVRQKPARSSSVSENGDPEAPADFIPPAGKRRYTREELGGYAKGLLAVSPDAALAELFGDRFYRGVRSVDELRRMKVAEGNGDRYPCVPMFPVHYAEPGDRLKFDIVQSIRTLTLLRQRHPEKVRGGSYHFRSPAEMWHLFREMPERLLERGRELAERCEFEFPFGPPQFPAFVPRDGSSVRSFLRRLVFQGLCERYPVRYEERRRQVEEELGIIHEVGYEEYFLVVWGLLQDCRARGISWITRGSAADSLVCYCLGISDVCPIRFDLYFRRFLNKERMQLNKLPDIDIDFPHDRKDEVIDLIFEKYGEEQAAVVGGFSTFQARSAVADVAKVLGMSEHQARRFTEHFPVGGARGVGEKVHSSQECRDLPLQEEPYRTALEMAEFLDGFPRYPKMHPCGVVLSREPMPGLVPRFTSNKGYSTTHYDMDAVEAMGLVKMDVLAQGGLSVMRDAQVQIALTQERPEQAGVLHDRGSLLKPQEINLRALEPWDDPEVWEMIANGGGRAVHHIESPAMVTLCRMCNVRDIDGLIAIVSVIRPGAANEQKKVRFARRYQGLEPVEYPHPCLESALRSTFGMVVYEEHILQICEAMAGFSPGRADVLRRALNKFKQETVEEIGKEFLVAARKRGHSYDVIRQVWEMMIGFSGYAFCKAHSTAYGVEAYQSAWLKRYFPAEFMAGVLTNGKGFYHPLVYVLECHRLGIQFLPPSVNEPGPEFNVVQGAIRVPVIRVKGLTERTIARLLEERQHAPFVSMQDFFRRVGPWPEEMERMIRVGALDCFGETRPRQFWEAQWLAKTFPRDEQDPRQGWLLPPPSLEQLREVPLEEPARRQRLEWENELLDFPVSGHPLDLHDNIAWETYCPVSRLGEHVGKQVVTCGLVIEQRLYYQVTGEAMKFLTLADWTGMVETELFAKTYRSYGLATVRYPVLEIEATVEAFESGRGFSLRVHRASNPRQRRGG